MTNEVKVLSDDEVARHVTEMQSQLDECAQSGVAYRVKWRDVKLTIAIIHSLRERLAQAKRWQFSVEEREAAVCPEDVGFDEYIRHLEKKLAHLEDTNKLAGVRVVELEDQLAQVTQERDDALSRTVVHDPCDHDFRLHIDGFYQCVKCGVKKL